MTADDDRAAYSRVEKELSTRWPEGRIDPTLDRIRALVDLLGNPQRAYPVVHLTGTNGKTSTTRMVDSLLRAFGLRTGRTTSPHLSSWTERIVLDGEPISGSRFAEIYDDVAPYLSIVDNSHSQRLSMFEVMTAMEFVAFADAPVDVAVVEVGLGGTWDSTNVADGQVAVVMPVAIDHAHYLGDTVEAIATEKAGIIKPGATAILAAQQESAAEVLLRRAADVGATVARQGIEFRVLNRSAAVDGQLLTLQGLGGRYDEVFLPLYGAHQAQNAVCALAAVEAFFGVGGGTGKTLDPDLVRAGFADVRSPGRLEVVRHSPTILVDAAHNPHGMTATVAALSESFAFTKLVGVLAVVADKDVRGILEVLEPALDSVVVTENTSTRRMSADDLAALAVDVFGADRVTVELRLDDAIDTAVRLAEEDIVGIGSSGVLVTGSVITAGDARIMLRAGPA